MDDIARSDTRRDIGSRDDFGAADYPRDDRYDADHRNGYRTERAVRRDTDDYGQADYSQDYAYDPVRGRGYRRFSDDDVAYDRDGRRRFPEDRSWADRAGDHFAARDQGRRNRRGPSDSVLWAVIVERLRNLRGMDLHDIEVIVDDAEVTLNGMVRHKSDKRRIEDVADIDGVRHVQNNLRVRERRWF
jgi:hypothetical protein